MKKISDGSEKTIWKKLCWLLSCMYGVLMFPPLWMSKYNHMCADDYGYGARVHRAWLETGSVTEVVNAAAGIAIDYYDWWQGTFSSLFLMALQPGVFGEKYYFLGTLMLFVFFHAAIIYLVRTVFCKVLGADKYICTVVTVVLLVLLNQRMDSPVEAFYFYNAGVHYIFMASVMLVMLSMQIRMLLPEEAKKQKVYSIWLILLGFVLGGGNYITAFLYILISVVYFGLGIWKKRKSCLYALPGFLIEVIAFAISAAAPGNAVRAERSDGLGVVETILISFKYSLEYINEHMDVVALLAFLLLLPLMWKAVPVKKFEFKYPGFVVVCVYCLYAAMYAPTCYALGYPGPGRCRNLYMLFLYLGFFFIELYLVGWLKNKVNLDEKVFEKPTWIGSGIICVFLCAMVLFSEPNDYMTYSAVKSLWHKEAQLYHVIHLERENILNTTDDKNVTVRSCPIRPYLLFFDDIIEDPEDWRNVSVAKWYNKKTVVAVEE